MLATLFRIFDHIVCQVCFSAIILLFLLDGNTSIAQMALNYWLLRMLKSLSMASFCGSSNFFMPFY